MSETIAPLPLRPLPLGSIEARGWLRTQLTLQANHITLPLGHEWPDISDSAWIGGKAEGWERGPYWLDGAVALAFSLKDEHLISLVKKWFDEIVKRQLPDGWLGPVKDQRYGDKYKAFDPWPVFVYLKAATQYCEATSDKKVFESSLNFLRLLHKELPKHPLFDWGKSRWADLIVSVYWFYEKVQEAWLLDLVRVAQTQGYDWRSHFENFRYREKVKDTFGQETHVVNSAMALKQPGLWSRLSQQDSDRTAINQMIQALDHYHGQVSGIFSGDEHYAGLNPSQGTETCAVVEYMYSLETHLSLEANVTLADRLEQIAFNALPASMSPDLKWHQYDQQANQVHCAYLPENIYTNNGPEANMFGLESNFGCCTANLHQGWPKFVAHLWRANLDGGLVALNYAPSVMNINTGILGNPSNTSIRAEMTTSYPFEDRITLKIEADANSDVPLYIRIPAWCDEARCEIGSQLKTFKGNQIVKILSQISRGQTTIHLEFPAKFKINYGYRNSATLTRGPLVFVHGILEEWQQHSKSGEPMLWEIKAKAPWQYALNLKQIEEEIKDVELIRKEITPNNQVYDNKSAPCIVKISAQRLTNWPVEKGAAGEIPLEPTAECDQQEKIELIPYGCARLRISAFPIIK